MPLPEPVHVHFRCEVELSTAHGAESSWKRALQYVRDWIGRVLETRATWDGWFETGSGGRRDTGPRRWAETRTAAGAWAVRAEHPDRQANGRLWRIDIGLERRETGIAASVATGWRLQSGWVGDEPVTPQPSAPAIVRQLVEERMWRATAGDLPLQVVPAILRVGSGEKFREELSSPRRLAPLVFASLDRGTGAPSLDTKRLAGLTAGAAVVVAPESLLVEPELEAVLPGRFQCRNGTVRIYEPGLTFSEGRDDLRHRYISAFEVRDRTPDATVEMIVRAVARLARVRGAARVACLEDVTEMEREARLAELRAGTRSGAEWQRALEEDNEALRAKQAQATADAQSAELRVLELEEKLEGAQADRKQSEYLLTEARNVEIALKRNASALAARAGAFEALENLPEKLVDVVDLVGKAFADRIVFTEKARESAAKSTYRNVAEAWRCLRAIATTLHALHFEGNLSLYDIRKKFEESTRYELGIGESAGTMNDGRLADKRSALWNGHVIDISTHVKVGRKAPDCLRVYYHPLRDEKRLVIGHCGDHLDTATTN